jgi:ribonucleoside-diphosphate reductase beta chain
MGPQELYELWERQSWSAYGIDLTCDQAEWAAMDAGERGEIAQALAAFFVGEERVTTQFSGLLMAYETQSEEAFLATQHVDEARHAQFFDRFYRQVVGIDDDFEHRLARARENVSDEFVRVFDDELVAAGRELVADPSDKGAKVDFITTYHMLIEGTMGLSGQSFITRALESRGVLPGLTEGFRRIATDEHRHVAYGTWYLQRAAGDARMRRRIIARLAALLPLAQRALVPPGVDVAHGTLLGERYEEINGAAFTALSRRMKILGIDLDRFARRDV